MNTATITKDKDQAIKIIRKLWPEIVIDSSNEHYITSDVVDFVYKVYLSAKQGDNVVKSLQPSTGLNPGTSFFGLGSKILQAVNIYLSNDKRENEWGLVVNAGVKAHTRAIKSALMYGTEVFPLDFDSIK